MESLELLLKALNTSVDNNGPDKVLTVSHLRNIVHKIVKKQKEEQEAHNTAIDDALNYALSDI